MVSVIMPLYNAESFMRDSIESVCQQSYRNLEIILVDDGSSDNTYAIAQELAHSDSRIVPITQPNAGPGAARNTGLSVAKGDFICFLDSDDKLSPLAIEKMLAVVDEETDLVQCKAAQLNGGNIIDSDEWLKSYIELDKLKAMRDYLYNSKTIVRYAVWAKLIRRNAIDGIYFPEMNNSEDVVFTTYLIDRCRKIKYIPDILYFNTVRDGSLTHTSVTKKKIEAKKKCSEMIRNFIYAQGDYSEFRSRADWSCFVTYINCAVEAKRNGIDGFTPKEIKKAVSALNLNTKVLPARKFMVYWGFMMVPNFMIKMVCAKRV